MPVSVLWGLLGQNCTCRKVRTISFNPEGPGVVWGRQDQSGGDQALKGVEGRLLFAGPMPLDVVLGEVKEGACMMGEVLDEPTVEVGKPEEGLQLLLGGQNWPLRHSGHFGWVHLDRVMGNDHSKVLHPGLLKFTLVWLQVDSPLGVSGLGG